MLTEHDSPRWVAREVGERIMRQDRVAPSLGITLDHIGPGTATVSMTPTDAMLNGVDIVHVGYLFVLADCAFALASNSHGPDAVARSAQIEFLAPARRGERLTACATERRRQGRGGIYDVVVTGPDDGVVAEFRGHARHRPRGGGDSGSSKASNA